MCFLVLILLLRTVSVKSSLGKCPAESPPEGVFEDKEAFRSFIMRCPGADICAYEKEFCQGLSFCPNQTDAELCRDPTFWKNKPCLQISTTYTLGLAATYLHSRCNLVGTDGWPGQCVHNSYQSDREYRCLDRSDSEDPFRTKNPIDFTKMKRCKYDNINESMKWKFWRYTEGYMCNGICRLRGEWCKLDTIGGSGVQHETCSELDGVALNDPQLCGNFSFWSESVSCAKDQYRCMGRYSGQCADIPTTRILGTSCRHYPCDNGIPISQCFKRGCSGNGPGRSRPCYDKSHLIQMKCQLFPENTKLENLEQCFLPPSKCNDTFHDHCKNICGSDNVDNITKSAEILKQFAGRLVFTPCSFCHAKAACPNPDYFVCEENENATIVAIHKDLVCDQHPQCLNGEDEKNCLHVYREKNFTTANAHFKCMSIYHPNVTVQAIICDGIAECFKLEDEVGCKTSIFRIEIIIILIAIVILSYFIPLSLSKLFYLKSQDVELSLLIEQGGLFSQIISAQTKKERRNLFMKIRKMHKKQSDHDTYRRAVLSLQMASMDVKNKDIVFALIYKIEAKIHRGSKKEVHLCLMQHQSHATCKAVLASVYPGFVKKYLENRCTRFINYKWNHMMKKPVINKCVSIFKRLLAIVVFYFDLLKDSFIILTLVNLVGINSVLNNTTDFKSQIIYVLILSVVFPIYSTSIRIAVKYPLVLFGYKTYNSNTDIKSWRTGVVQILIILFAPIVPALLIDLKEKEYEDLRVICQTNSEDESIINREEFLNLIKKLMLHVKKLELCVEVAIQITVPLIMILLEATRTKTVTGLEFVFKTDPVQIPYLTKIPPETVLVISIIWSLKTAILTFLKMKSIERDSFLTAVGKIILFTRAVLVLSARFASYLLFFTPFVGLFDILGHHFVERFPFNPSSSLSSNSSLTYWHDGHLRSVSWTKLFKHYTEYSTWNCTQNEILNNPSECLETHHPGTSTPSYSDYTGMELQSAYLTFWALIVGHIVLSLLLKSLINRNDPDWETVDISVKLHHSLETLHIPDVMQYWDEGSPDLTNCEQRWHKIRWEMLCASILHWISNCSLIAPVIFTGLRVVERHSLLAAAIGVRREEQDSYNTALLFLWLPALSITLSSILDFGLFLLYNRIGHPWKELLKVDEILEIDEEFTDILEDDTALDDYSLNNMSSLDTKNVTNLL